MKLTSAQRTEIKTRIAIVFGKRRTVIMDTSSEIGTSNFYGDESKPRLTRTQVLQTIEMALDNWTQPEEKESAEWVEEIAEDIISDIL